MPVPPPPVGTGPDRAGAAVVDGTEAARALVAAGIDVVVVLPEGVTLGAHPPGPGRLAVLVGDWADDGVRWAAATMWAELFGT